MSKLAKAEKSPINTIGKLNLIFGVYGGNILYSIYLDYANKLQNPEEYTRFSIDEDGFLPKAYGTISQYMGIPKDTVIKTIAKLVKMGLLQKKPGTEENNNIPYYQPVLKSSVFINLINEKLDKIKDIKHKYDREARETDLKILLKEFEKTPHAIIVLGFIKEENILSVTEKLQGYDNSKENLEEKQEEVKQEETLFEEQEKQEEPNPQKTPLPEYKHNRDPFKLLNFDRKAN